MGALAFLPFGQHGWCHQFAFGVCAIVATARTPTHLVCRRPSCRGCAPLLRFVHARVRFMPPFSRGSLTWFPWGQSAPISHAFLQKPVRALRIASASPLAAVQQVSGVGMAFIQCIVILLRGTALKCPHCDPVRSGQYHVMPVPACLFAQTRELVSFSGATSISTSTTATT